MYKSVHGITLHYLLYINYPQSHLSNGQRAKLKRKDVYGKNENLPCSFEVRKDKIQDVL